MLNKDKKAIHDTIIDCMGVEKDISLEVALQYNESYNSNIYYTRSRV